ncbi:hypothetical protein NDU88_007327 [Pleurodeles waltl]|uniref:Uncharacterized protein n=1 Tax=Pleurodeles waltl TaxID=8319 RepID=A0AAV7NUM4_PLEWA|nr:hypothetical protein NDU88_007327 [Pleurodeles waltl]
MRSWRSFPCALRCLGKTSRRPAALRGSSGRVCGASRFPFWTICSCAAVHLAGLQVEYAGVPLSRPCPDRRGSQTAGSVAIGSTDWQVLREDMQHKRVQTNLTKPLSKKNTILIMKGQRQSQAYKHSHWCAGCSPTSLLHPEYRSSWEHVYKG